MLRGSATRSCLIWCTPHPECAIAAGNCSARGLAPFLRSLDFSSISIARTSVRSSLSEISPSAGGSGPSRRRRGLGKTPVIGLGWTLSDDSGIAGGPLPDLSHSTLPRTQSRGERRPLRETQLPAPHQKPNCPTALRRRAWRPSNVCRSRAAFRTMMTAVAAIVATSVSRMSANAPMRSYG